MTDDIEHAREEGLDGRTLPMPEALLRAIIENIPVGIVIQDVEGRDVIANIRAQEILGMDKGEITERRYDSEEWDPRDRDGMSKMRQEWTAEKVRRSGEPIFGDEVMVPRPDGSKVLLSVNASPLKNRDGSFGGLVYSFEDITQRIRVEQELAAHRERLQELVEEKTTELREANRRLQEEIGERKRKEEELQQLAESLSVLSQRMENIREEEKELFAARIHDTLGQSLAILKMQIKDLERVLSVDERKGDELERIYSTLNLVLDEVRGLSEELKPRILNDAGLVAAMEWQIKEMHDRTGIDTYFHSDIDGLFMSEILKTFVYRVFQEAIDNVVKHADSLHINVDLSVVDRVLVLKVVDDGKGISQEELASPESLSLMWMKERAKHFGGTIDIAGKPSEGTWVTLRIPISRI